MPTSAKDIVAARHSIYSTNSGLWQYFADHAAGGPNYPQKFNPLSAAAMTVTNPIRSGSARYLVQHPLEDSEDFILRLYKCPAVNLCGPAIDLMAGTVGNPDSVVMNIPTDFGMLIDDADLMGDSFSQFMLSARTMAAALGHVFILCDSTRAAGEIRTQADVINQGVRPYFRMISPQDMLSWRLDGNGKPIEVLFRVPVEAPGSILDAAACKDQQFEYRFWSREQWIVFKQVGEDIQPVDQGPNPLREIPIAVLYHRRVVPFLGESLLKESAKFSQILTNWLSNLDRTMTMQSFSQACLRSTDVPSQVGVGASKVLHLHPDRKEGDTQYGAEDYFYRTPDSAPLQVMWDSFFRIVDMANGSMSLKPEATTDKSHPESGISRAWRWHSTEKRLVQMAGNEQEAARSLFYFAARWKGQDNFSGSIVYGTHFDLSDLSDDIEAMLSLQTIGLPATASTELKARAVKKALPNLAPDKQTAIDKELVAMHTAVDSRLNKDLLSNLG